MEKTVLYIRYKISLLIKANLKIQMQYNGIFSNHRLKTWIRCNNAMASFQTTGSMFFMHRNEIGLLTHFAKINKREGLNKVWGGWEKIWELISDPPLVLNTQEYTMFFFGILIFSWVWGYLFFDNFLRTKLKR